MQLLGWTIRKGTIFNLDKTDIIHTAAIALGYIIGTELSYFFYTAPAVFPFQSAAALAGLVLTGVRMWPAVFIGAFFSYTWHDTDPILTLAFAIGNTLQAVIGASICKKLQCDLQTLQRSRDVFILILVALTASTIVPTIGLIGYEIRELIGGPPLPIPWVAWWIGHLLSLLIVAPFLIRWISRPYIRRTGLEFTEIIAALIVLISVNILLFWTTFEQLRSIPLAYMVLLPLMWFALRLGPRMMTLALFLTSVMVMTGIAFGPDTEAASLPLGERLLLAEIFLEVIAAIFLILVSIEEERKETAKKLNRHVERLQDALGKIRSEDTAKTEFIATLAHELRNPLAPIVSSLELLRLRKLVTEAGISILDLVEDRVRTMRRLLDDLMDISRISRKKMELKKEMVSAHAVVNRVVRAMESTLKERRQSVELNLASEAFILKADPIRLEQIFTNLLTNASKFSGAGGAIEITTDAGIGDFFEFRVRDQGIGIEQSMLESIFQPFLQITRNGESSGGLGIGLSLTKELVELHGGTITAYSEGVGKGSEFVVRLPIEKTAATLPILKEPEPIVNASPSRILVVDDNAAAASAMSSLLKLNGHEVMVAYTGSDTEEKAAAFKPDVILLDLGLPDMSGYDVARSLREELRFRGLIVALTGYGQREDREKTAAAGFDHHLVKPVSINDILAIVSLGSAPATRPA